MNDSNVWAAVAAALGLLAFFEPCTIATHALFSARVHARRSPAGHGELLALWAVRSLVLIGLLLLAVALPVSPRLGGYGPSIALAGIASVYLVSRIVYIPVPHVELWKLLPGGAVYPHAVRLGLTLPACTLPLVVIVMAVLAALDSWPAAVGAGLLFATLFTAPTVAAALVGLSGTGRRFLNGAARVTPYVTAGLLYGAAVNLLP